MMNKTKSGRAQLLKFLVAIPLIAAVVVAFRNEPQKISVDTPLLQNDTMPRKVNPAVPPRVSELPANVRSISITDDAAIVKLKDGTKEMYNLDDPDERKKYEAKYGPVPEPPVPPVPPTEVKAPEPPHVVVAPNEYTDFLKRNQNVKNLRWRSHPDRIIINFKDGGKEEIASDDENAMKNAVAKYGRFPVGPPPPPPPPSAPAAPIPPDPPAKEGSTTNKTAAPSASNVYSFSAVDELTVSTVKGFTGVKPATGAGHVTTVLTAEVIEFDNGMHKSPDDKVELIVELSLNTNKATLDQLISNLAAKGFTLQFDLIEFENQQLSTVKGSISYKHNKSHFTASNFSELSIGWVRQVNGKTGFRILVHNGSVKI